MCCVQAIPMLKSVFFSIFVRRHHANNEMSSLHLPDASAAFEISFSRKSNHLTQIVGFFLVILRVSFF
jgi:hypothetical protein